MESLKSQFGLRSMDMEGRSLGTERPSVSTGRQAGADTPEARNRFTSLLAERTKGGTRAIEGVGQAVEDDIASRIRDGRTDAAESGGKPDDSVRDREEDASPAEREESASDGERGRREDSESRRSREEPGRASSGESSQGGDLSSKERGSHLTDASEAGGAESDGPPEDQVPGAPGATFQQAPPPPRGALGPAAALAPQGSLKGGSFVALAGGAGRALPKGQFNGISSPNQAKSAPSKPAALASTAPRPGSSAMERAEAILEQLKVRIQSGGREARLQLRPVDLGRLDVHIRVDAGKVTASIAAESAETLSVLEAHAPELRAWLSKDGAESVELDLYVMDDASKDEHRRGMSGQGGQRGAESGGAGSQQGGHGPSHQNNSTVPTSALRVALGASLESQPLNPGRPLGGVDLVG